MALAAVAAIRKDRVVEDVAVVVAVADLPVVGSKGHELRRKVRREVKARILPTTTSKKRTDDSCSDVCLLLITVFYVNDLNGSSLILHLKRALVRKRLKDLSKSIFQK
jgi:hypothetical protein